MYSCEKLAKYVVSTWRLHLDTVFLRFITMFFFFFNIENQSRPHIFNLQRDKTSLTTMLKMIQCFNYIQSQ